MKDCVSPLLAYDMTALAFLIGVLLGGIYVYVVRRAPSGGTDPNG